MKRQIPEVRNPYNYDSDALSDKTGLLCQDESLTQQEHAQEADINYIADTFMRTGQMPQVIHMPTQGDFTGVFDFQSALNTINEAKHEFMKLPAKIRSRFENDPAQLIEFLENGDNRDEAIRLGLLEKPTPAPNTEGTGNTQIPTTTGKGPTTREPGPKDPEPTGRKDKTA